MITDLLDREIKLDNYVVFHNNLYQVKGLGKDLNRPSGSGQVRILLIDKSPTTRSVVKYSKDLCLVPEGDVLFWMLKK